MTRDQITPDVARIAFTAAEGFPFERFAQSLQAYVAGVAFVPTGGVGDGGADGVTDALSEHPTKPTNFFQSSVRADTETKIRQTVARLREVGREVRVLTYMTSRAVPKFDILETSLSDELDVTVRIRDLDYIVAHLNDDVTIQSAYNQHIAHYADYLKRVGSSKIIPTSRHVKSPAVYAFLTQEMARRDGDVTSLHAMVDALVLWSLEGTDPDEGIFMSREEVLVKISAELPAVAALIEPELSARIEGLSSKGTRLVRWHRKDDKFCLPFETRREIEAENAADVLLVESVLAGLEDRAREILDTDKSASASVAAQVAMRALQMTFEKQGLEFAAFLNDPLAAGAHPEVDGCIAESLEICGVAGKRAVEVGPLVFSILRAVFYDSTDAERSYLHRLSTTYALLFILKTEPRLLEFFQDMTGDFYLYVGTDQILRALSEHYLPPADQMTRNCLQIAASLGATLVLTEPVLREIVSHFRACDLEFKNHISGVEPFMNYELARNVGPIMIRAYLYARINPDLPNGPRSWSAYVQQFCTYENLHHGSGEEDFMAYLVKKFSMEFVKFEDLEDLVDIEDVGELAHKLESSKTHRELADNDALLAHAVYGRRRHMNEFASANEFGFTTWWLTGETSILRHTRTLVEQNNRARYMMRPEFILNFVSLAPSAEKSRQAFASVFPTLLGVKLAKRMDASAFNRVLDKVKEASEMDDARRSTIIASVVNKLKSDFSKTYATSTADAIDGVAARIQSATS